MTAMEVSGDMGKLIVSFRGQKIELSANPNLTVGQVKSTVASAAEGSVQLSPTHVKLIYKGKVLSDDDDQIIISFGGKPAKAYRLLATGLSTAEQGENQQYLEQVVKNARIRDDLSDKGRQDMIHRRHLGQVMLQNAAAKINNAGGLIKYGFGAIEVLPNLPEETTAREILTTLANDPGVLSVMAKHQWNVGCLAELYPEGKVGESAVCVMGLNKNKGQTILLRIRTDDLRGFRKMLSIRKVLFHELAHNVHSDHNQDFFQLMRQIERECHEMDWTQGSGTTVLETGQAYVAGSYRLGGSPSNDNESSRELAARAAMQRLTAEEQEIYEGCGCGREPKFLPPSDESSRH